ncbi:MG2 domain-containing protein [Flavobacterium sp. SUN052]|uniref:alpha-2-macroglobulin family protein n=1 Tax=Flavobacterium sp. SUN052 TaxID=3002441 RepID=UPI00237E3715|nr:MG2 domain-containing protein [Flavobacterium sp. SUN052]MEC4004506.1 MG2 domain-containing protein [Flavobacterium sp. SUN052]
MKKITFILFLFTYISSCGQNHDKSWENIVALENKGQTKSANNEVERIYKIAYNSKNEVQIIKCFFYKSKYIQSLDENAQSKIISNLRKEINTATIPSKAILNLVYAKCLNSYYKKNSYLLQNRTKVDSTQLGDFLTWTKYDFDTQIEAAYQNTLKEELILKQTSLHDYEAIFDLFKTDENNVSSVYDYILQENINYYSSVIYDWKSVVFNSKTNLDLLFATNTDFKTIKLDSLKDPEIKKVIELYKKVNYLESSSTTELERILFCHKHILKNDELIKHLNALEKRSKSEMLTQRILYEKAVYFNSLANKETNPDYKSIAVSKLDSILNFKNKSNTFKKANLLKYQITSKEANLNLLGYCYENENTRTQLNYRNLDSVRLSFYKINSNLIGLQADTLKDFISKLKPIITKNYKLLNKKDYLNYTTELLLPKLELGIYVISLEGINDKTNNYQIITVSNNIVLTSNNSTITTYKILNRKTGKPVVDCRVKSVDFDLVSDKNGIVSFDENSNKTKKNYNYRDLLITSKNDTLSLKDSYINNQYYNNDDKESKSKVSFFLDRAIYRPGQTVYYKGIVTKENNSENSIVANLLVKITIDDANYNEIKTFEVTTNEFGSFAGEFNLPKNGITGEFTIEADEPDDLELDPLYDKIKEEHPFWDTTYFEHSEIRFSVEEYKRPKFEIIFNPIKDTYSLNQDIQVKGTAKAFTGSSISNSKVSYQVVRKNYNWNKYRGNNNDEILATSETKTDALGNFIIDFKAIPYEDIDQVEKPVFSYYVNVKITDINGETHTGETFVNVGYQSLLLKAKINSKINSNEKNTIELNSTNLNNQFSAVNGEVKIYFLKNFEGKFKPRTFVKPEINGISNDDFEKLFPFEFNENEMYSSLKGTLVYSKKVATEKDKSLALDFISNFKSGHYKLIFSATDRSNIPVETTSLFDLYQVADKIAVGNEFITMRQLNENPKKDGFVLVQINCAVPELYLNYSVIYDGKIVFENNQTTSNYSTQIKIPIEKNFKDFFKIGIETMYENHHFIAEKNILIPEEWPKMEIEIETFRDKLEPGKLENWSFKIKENNDKTQVEVLASMYDVSLEQFKKSYWNPLISRRYNNDYFSGKSVLGSEIVTLYYNSFDYKTGIIDYQNETTNLIWFGFDFVNPNNAFITNEYRKQVTKKARKPANTKLISGILTDGKLPLPGANVIVKGKIRGTSTNLDGYYEIEAGKGETLVFSYLGFNNASILIGKSKQYDVSLKESENTLNEVVVTAMGIKRTKDAVVSAQRIVTFLELTQETNPNAIQALAGKVSGLQITTQYDKYSFATNKIVLRGNRSVTGNNEALVVIDGEISNATILAQMSAEAIADINVVKGAQGAALYGAQGANGVIIITTKKGVQELTQVKTRTNRNETAFFFPQLKTDKNGKISFNFTSPEELTQWKLRLFAHNKNANVGYLEKLVITQKELMIFPNMPRFFREKDTIVISAKISNLTPNVKNGIALLQLSDATTMETIDNKMMNVNAVRNFNIAPTGNTIVTWKITVPEGVQGIQYKVVAKADNYSDGEESILPVLTNNILVTESIPIWVRENSKKAYTFDNLKNNTSTTLKNHLFTLEYTSNPTWLAIQSLPYLMEYEHECAEQTFARYYANVLASEIINTNPKIAAVFENWKKTGKTLSKLNQNEELKSLILAETPWLKEAQSEEEKKNNLALLFNLENMKISTENTFEKLKTKQKPSGGFAWFDGGNESEYITTHIISGLGHLQKLQINKITSDGFSEITKKAITYLDTKFIERNNSKNAVNYSDLYYLYMRSFYLKMYPISNNLNKIITLQLENIDEKWLDYSIYNKALAALVLNRFGESERAEKIIESLKDTSASNEDWGMYWIENKPGWNWYEAPIETQALVIEAFSEITKDTKSIDAMKVWLLKNKQTKNWPTTKSTTEAIYALLLNGSNWLSVKDNTIIKIGDDKIVAKKLSENQKEAETGYIKLNWKSTEIKPEMATTLIENKSKVPGFGGLYWQYFEDLDKIKTNNNNNNMLTASKELYLKKKTNKGDELQKITATNTLKIGDLVTVRLIITAKEDLEYIHLKDMRASCFEPINVISQYEWKADLSYYVSTKDAATHFFFDEINKGTYVIEYEIIVNNSGNFSNGITTIESMYAPEFTSHTKGIRVTTKE